MRNEDRRGRSWGAIGCRVHALDGGVMLGNRRQMDRRRIERRIRVYKKLIASLDDSPSYEMLKARWQSKLAALQRQIGEEE